ncbi:phosphate ABC transporter substrate-binding/OmpA family protein [Desulfococcaceae bacterium HSG7]|nr:phosphate ABC transporter substrate-binding/OmpA family protein [Desulfococcaceae bacterium HSG7]
MNKSIKGALIIIILVVIGSVSVKLLLPLFEASHQKATSDAAKTKGKIRLALDNWIGYFPLRSTEMKNLMRRSGWNLICEDDNADYDKRMARLQSGEIELAVATVDSFILNSAPHHFPGIIIMVIDESAGGDAILARKDRVASLDALKGLNDIKVAFTPNSPSHHFAKAVADHFNAPELLPQDKLRIETGGSSAACEKLIKGQTDIAICWEPDVSRALAKKDIVKLIGTEDTERLIVDILIAGRDFAQKHPEVIKILLSNYFKALKKYRDHPDLLSEQVKETTDLNEKSVESMLKGVNWANFNANCENWFGITSFGGFANEGLIATIDSTIKILINSGDFSQSPIPDDDPYRLTNSSFLETLFTQGVTGFTRPKPQSSASNVNSIEARFGTLSDAEWKKLKEVGTLKVDPIVFQHGTTELDIIAKKVVDNAVTRLEHYPNFRMVIKGHTGTRGDSDENQRLSQERAQAVARYLTVVFNVDPNRLRAIGFGGSQPLPRKSGESLRTWKYRLPRVELVLVKEDY